MRFAAKITSSTISQNESGSYQTRSGFIALVLIQFVALIVSASTANSRELTIDPATGSEAATKWLKQQSFRIDPSYFLREVSPNAHSIVDFVKNEVLSPSTPPFTHRYKGNHSASYPAVPGIAVYSYDYLNYKDKIGDFSYYSRRCYLYDQALAAIASLIQGDVATTRAILDYTCSFQNIEVKIPGAMDGSFGFSFKVGRNDDKIDQINSPRSNDFYDMNYLRSGTIAWIGYALAFYQRVTGDDRYYMHMMRTAEFLLGMEIVVGPNASLITGGYGTIEIPQNAIDIDTPFVGKKLQWCGTEHNIDCYFFFRELFRCVSNSHFRTVAERIRNGMRQKLLATDKSAKIGRFHQAFIKNEDRIDREEALDASSWGAMFWLAGGQTEHASQALEYVETRFKSTVNEIEGYKPYAGVIADYQAHVPNWDNFNIVWSEGSLGVALAYIKLGKHKQASAILKQMEKLQSLDSRGKGGFMYTIYNGKEVPYFLRVPSLAGAAWYIIAHQLLKGDETAKLFWDTDE